MYQIRPLRSRMKSAGTHQSSRSRTAARAAADRPVDLPVALKLAEEGGHEPGHGRHRHVALHGEDCGNACLGQARAKRREHPAVVAVPVVRIACALA